METHGLFIDGRWRPSAGSGTFETRNPATGETLAVFPLGTSDDVDAAVEAAQRALPGWKRTPAPRRAGIVLEAASILRRRKEELARTVTMEMGKVIAEGRGDVEEAIEFLEYVAGEGRRMFGETTPSQMTDKFAMTVRQPIGVVGCITPWNFPVALPAWKIGAALVAGNTIVFKPASLTPLGAAMLVEVFEQAGLPRGVLNLVTGPAESVGAAIVEHPAIRAVSFTGGVPSGTDVYAKAARLLKRVQLELGGKNPQIVMDDADIDLAVKGALFGAFGTAGQRCTATSRLIIHEKVYDATLERLLAGARALAVGNPLDPAVDVGPVSSSQQEEKVLRYIGIGKEEGARLLFGGEKLRGGSMDGGFFIRPAVFEARPDMRIAREEIFGPVLAVLRARSYEEAVETANDVPYGLSSSIYTASVGTAFRAIRDLEAGIVYVNAPTIGAEVHLPFGGVKQTGNGGREAGTEAIKEFTELKTVFVDYSGRLQRAQIDG